MPLKDSMSVTTSASTLVHHCPVENCRYSSGSERYFTAKRFLNQHIEKVHAEKKYVCSKCQKGFGTDWLRKNHEICCGRIYKCSCGVEYSSRDSLYSHARRKDHYISDELMLTPKQILSLTMKKLASQPTVFVIQPVIQQQVSLVISAAPSSTDKRKILPKSPVETVVSPVDMSTSNLAVKQDKSQIAGAPKPLRNAHNERSRVSKSERKQKFRSKSAAETQTCDELKPPKGTHTNPRKLESRGSQCSVQVKRQRVGIESTHTQTTASAVVGMKTKPPSNCSKRKSVAVVTDSEILHPTRSLWSNFEEFMLSSETMKTSSTQTSPDPCTASTKVMCDSQTATDDDLFSFAWPPKEASMDSLSYQMDDQCSSGHTSILSDKIFNDTFMTCEKPSSCNKYKPYNSMAKVSGTSFDENIPGENNIPTITSLIDSCVPSASETAEIHSFVGEKTVADITSFSENTKIEEELADLDSVLGTVLSSTSDFSEIDPPLLLHTQTQTNLPLDIDYSSILANMETQTTDDFFFDLEFSDTETQTPWEDIPYISGELSTSQLSTEIQTDFSVASSSGYNSSSKEPGMFLPTEGKHMETQTSDLYQMPQLTNSEAQTLTAASYLFT